MPLQTEFGNWASSRQLSERQRNWLDEQTGRIPHYLRAFWDNLEVNFFATLA